jgi:hypothetical protein
MTPSPRPTVYGAYAHVWLREFSLKLPGRPLTLAEVPDAELDRLQSLGVNWFWLIGAWQTGPHGRTHAVSHPDLRRQCRKILDDFAISDMVGSPYAVQEYRVHRALGGDEALLSLRAPPARRGIRLMLDLVPNHTACDHPWVREHPDYYVQGSLADLEARRGFFAETARGDSVILHGKDPHFEPWTDTAQLDWRNPALVEAMTAQVEGLTGLCDGLRCDMAMLVLSDVFRRTWGAGPYPEPAFEPWSAIVSAARARAPAFVFLAEVYWNMEERLIKLGFDWVYDKVLYDPAAHDSADNVAGTWRASTPSSRWRCASWRTTTSRAPRRPSPGAARGRRGHRLDPARSLLRALRQMEGRREKLPIQLGRAPAEPVDDKLVRLLPHAAAGGALGGRAVAAAALPSGLGRQLHARRLPGQQLERRRAAPARGGQLRRPARAVLRGPLPAGHPRRLARARRRAEREGYQREGRELRTHGLYVDLPAWGAHLFRFGK